MRMILILGCAVLIGCSDPGSPARGQARIELFKQCMELASKMPRQSDDDVADIVSTCGTQSWYMTNHMR